MRQYRVLVVFLPGLLWWIACFPGNLSFDSIGSLAQIASGDYWNNHPVAFTLYVQVLTLGGSAVWLLTLVQSVALTASLYAVARSLDASRNVSALTAGLLMITPWAGPFAVTVWKDVPYAILMLWGVVLALNASKRSSWWLAVGAGGVLAFGTAMRHNGWPAAVAAAAILAVILLIRRSWRSGVRVVVALLIGAVGALGIAQVALAVTSARPLDPWFTYQTVLADLAYADAWHPEQMPSGLHEYVSTFARGAALEGAKECSVINRLVYGEGFDARVANATLSEAVYWYGQLARTAPQYIAQARACRAAAFLPPPLSSGPKYIYLNELGVYPNDLGIVRTDPVPALSTAAVWLDSMWVAGGRVLAWPGLIALLGTIAIYLRTRHRPDRWLASAAWVSVTWGTLAVISLVSVAQDFRYGVVPAFVSLVAVVVGLADVLRLLKNRGARSIPVRPSPAEPSPSGN